MLFTFSKFNSKIISVVIVTENTAIYSISNEKVCTNLSKCMYMYSVNLGDKVKVIVSLLNTDDIIHFQHSV